jgi:hypothetical protein
MSGNPNLQTLQNRGRGSCNVVMLEGPHLMIQLCDLGVLAVFGAHHNNMRFRISARN